MGNAAGRRRSCCVVCGRAAGPDMLRLRTRALTEDEHRAEYQPGADGRREPDRHEHDDDDRGHDERGGNRGGVDRDVREAAQSRRDQRPRNSEGDEHRGGRELAIDDGRDGADAAWAADEAVAGRADPSGEPL